MSVCELPRGRYSAWSAVSSAVRWLSTAGCVDPRYGGDTLTIRSEPQGEVTVLTISDNGPGLGLYIVRDLMELNGGRIDYSATPEGGAAFTLRLPRPH